MEKKYSRKDKKTMKGRFKAKIKDWDTMADQYGVDKDVGIETEAYFVKDMEIGMPKNRIVTLVPFGDNGKQSKNFYTEDIGYGQGHYTITPDMIEFFIDDVSTINENIMKINIGLFNTFAVMEAPSWIDEEILKHMNIEIDLSKYDLGEEIFVMVKEIECGNRMCDHSDCTEAYMFDLSKLKFS